MRVLGVYSSTSDCPKGLGKVSSIKALGWIAREFPPVNG